MSEARQPYMGTAVSANIATLTEDPANVRLHPQRNLDAIKASLKRFGQQRPIVVDKNHIVRAGNATLQAARELGWERLDIIVSDLAPAELTAYAIADNRTAELAEWSFDLAAQVEALKEEGFDLEDIGFTAAEFDALIATLGTPEVEFKEYDESAANGVKMVTCPECGNEFPL